MFSDPDITTAMAVNRSGSIRGAAKLMHKSQPAVSQAIMRLEGKLGFKLFDRSQYRIALTEQGRDFLQRAEAMLSIDAQLQDYAEVIRAGQESTLHLAVWPVVNQLLLTRVLGLLNEKFPHTSVHINYVESLGALQELVDDKAALAIYPAHTTVQTAKIEARVIDKINFVNVISQKLLDEKIPERNLREQLLLWNRVMMQDSVSGKSYGLGLEHGGKRWMVNDQRILSALIFNGIAWGMLPEPVVRDELKSGQLVALDFPEFGSDLKLDIVIGRIKGSVAGPVATACWNAFTEFSI